jgi:hypothetical protein
LLVTFAQQSDGAYLSSVDVRVVRVEGGQANAVSTDLTTHGPILLANLPPGQYMIHAELAGFGAERREVTIPEDGGALQKLYVTMTPLE